MTPTPVEEAAAAAARGELVIFPTDTVYGLGTRPDDPAATARVFATKGRPLDLTLPVLVDSLDAARSVARFDERAGQLALTTWPGALTLVLPRTSVSRPWDLGGAGDTVGVRMPRHPLALALLGATGPLAVTSANRSGEPPVRTCDELTAVFGDRVAVYLCEESPLEGLASTVLDLTGPEIRLLRAGSVDPAALAASLAGEEPLLDSRPSGSAERP